MDHSRRLLRGCSPPHRPGPAFVFPHSEERLEAEECVRFADERVERGFPDPVFFHERPGVFLPELGELHLDLAEKREHPRVPAFLPLRGTAEELAGGAPL